MKRVPHSWLAAMQSSQAAMTKKKAGQPPSPNILDYPNSMSLHERESLAAEAKPAAEGKIRKRPKPPSNSK
jgi:hypothetical protein